MIEIKGVTKYFKEKKQTIAAVQDIHVSSHPSELVIRWAILILAFKSLS